MAILKALVLVVLYAETWVPGNTSEVVFQGTKCSPSNSIRSLPFFSLGIESHPRTEYCIPGQPDTVYK